MKAALGRTRMTSATAGQKKASPPDEHGGPSLSSNSACWARHLVIASGVSSKAAPESAVVLGTDQLSQISLSTTSATASSATRSRRTFRRLATKPRGTRDQITTVAAGQTRASRLSGSPPPPKRRDLQRVDDWKADSRSTESTASYRRDDRLSQAC